MEFFDEKTRLSKLLDYFNTHTHTLTLTVRTNLLHSWTVKTSRVNPKQFFDAFRKPRRVKEISRGISTDNAAISASATEEGRARRWFRVPGMMRSFWREEANVNKGVTAPSSREERKRRDRFPWSWRGAQALPADVDKQRNQGRWKGGRETLYETRQTKVSRVCTS